MAGGLFTFLLVTKLCLLLWNLVVKQTRPLADVPPDGVFFIVGGDLLVCLGVAVICLILHQVERLGGQTAHVMGKMARGLFVGGIILFSVISFQVARIYGEMLEIDLLRSADSLIVLRQSIWAYIGPMPVVLLIYGLICVPLMGRWLASRLARRRWLTSRVGLWAGVTILCMGAAFMQRMRLHRIDTFGVKDNAIVFFIKEYRPAFRPIDAPGMIRKLEAQLAAEQQRPGPAKSLVVSGGVIERDFPFAPPPEAKDLNVIVIQMESTGVLHLDETSAPNITALQNSGLAFKRHITVATQTRPASVGLYYSDYLPELGTTPSFVYGRPMPQPALGDVMKAAGYHTGVFHTGFLDYVELRFLFAEKGMDVLVGAREMVEQGVPLAYSAGVHEESTVDAMTAWIRQRKGEKFFAAYMTEFPHHPYMTMAKETPFPDDTWLNRYKNSLHYADSAVGRLMDFLRTEGLLDKTLIVVVGDHGETVSSYPVGHGLRVSAEEMRTPFILNNSKLFPYPMQSKVFTNHLDVAPTIVSLLGLTPPREWLGRNVSAAQIPAVLQFVAVTHIRKQCVMDNGLLYVHSRESDGWQMYEMGDRDLMAVPESDPRRALHAAYREEADWYGAWSVWRHLTRAQQGNPAGDGGGTRDLVHKQPPLPTADGGAASAAFPAEAKRSSVLPPG